MIPLVPGWKIYPEAGMLELVHPRGRAHGVIHYRERMRPLRKLGALVREYLAITSSFTPAEPPVTERLTTHEGEHAALVTIRGAEHGTSAQHDLGFVFGDDFFASVSGQCFEPALFAELTTIVRRLVTSDSHGLGTRRRRFEYAAPTGWQPIVEGFVTDWYPPGFPNDSVIVTVRPALPRSLEPLELISQMVQELAVASYHVEVESPPAPIRASTGPSGATVTLRIRREHAPGMLKQVAIVQDTVYSYPIEVTAGTSAQLAAHPGLLETLVDSIRPVPQANLVSSEVVQMFSHWSE